jgi:hypothetical protein
MSVSQPSPALLEQWAQPGAHTSEGNVHTPALHVGVVVTCRLLQSWPHVPQFALSFGTQMPLQKSCVVEHGLASLPPSPAVASELASLGEATSAGAPSEGAASAARSAAASVLPSAALSGDPSDDDPASDASPPLSPWLTSVVLVSRMLASVERFPELLEHA